MYTIIETPTFKSEVDRIWSEEERSEFFTWLSVNALSGDVIPASGGCRKVRWSKKGIGKRGGVRVIYFVKVKEEEIWLLVIYSKSVKDNIPAHILKSIREVLEND